MSTPRPARCWRTSPKGRIRIDLAPNRMGAGKGMRYLKAVKLRLAACLLGTAAAVTAPATGIPKIVTARAHEVIHANAGVVSVVVVGAPPDARLQPVLDGTPQPRQKLFTYGMRHASDGVIPPEA